MELFSRFAIQKISFCYNVVKKVLHYYMLYGIRSVMSADEITVSNFTKHYFDVDKTKDLIIWLVKQWKQEMEIVDAQADANGLPLISSTFRRLFRLICTTRGLESLKFPSSTDGRDEVLGVTDDGKAKEFTKKLLEKVLSEDVEQEHYKCGELKEFFEESLCEYIRFQDPEKKFREVIKNKRSIFHLIGSPKCPIYIRIDLLTELSFRKLRKASEDTLFEIDSKIQTELEEMVEYGDALIERIESDYHVVHLEDQLLGSPSSSIATFNLRKTLIKLRYSSSPKDVFESAMNTIKLYKYPRDELRAIYGQIWSYHAIMRAHMFRGDEIHVELYKKIIDSMVSCLVNPKKDVSKENTEAEEMNDKYIIFGKYFESWKLTNHDDIYGRNHEMPEGLKLIQKEFFSKDNKNRTAKWDWETSPDVTRQNLKNNKIYPYGKTFIKDKKTGIQKKPFSSLFDSIEPGIDKFESKTSFVQGQPRQGRHGNIFVTRKELDPEMKKQLILAIPGKLDECIGKLLTSKSPLKISYLRLMTREYLLQFTKIACTNLSKRNGKRQIEPSYDKIKTIDERDEKFESFLKVVHKDLKDVLDSLHEEFDLMQEHIAMKEIKTYIECIKTIEKEPAILLQKGLFGGINYIGGKIQGELKKYICEEISNSKLYFPRKYPRTNIRGTWGDSI